MIAHRLFRKKNQIDPEKDEMIRKAIHYTKGQGVKGDYFEFGVYRGSSFISAYNHAKRYGLKNMKFYAFDSFQGLPINDVDTVNFPKHRFSCNVEKFKKNLVKNKIDLERVEIVEGFYDEVLTEDLKKTLSAETLAVCLIDCDLYSSTKSALEFLTGYLCDGSVLIFDDWFMFKGRKDRGEQKAFYEWLKRYPSIQPIHYLKYSTVGNSFIINFRE